MSDKEVIGDCEWCGKRDVPVSPIQDSEEGPSGSEYYVCVSCAQKQNEQDRKEVDSWDNWDAYEDEISLVDTYMP